MGRQVIEAYTETIMALVSNGPNKTENRKAVAELLQELVAKEQRPQNNSILFVQPSEYWKNRGRRRA